MATPAALVRSDGGWRATRVAVLGDDEVVVLADDEAWVPREAALLLLGVRRARGIAILAGLEHRGSGRRGDPRMYLRRDVLANRP